MESLKCLAYTSIMSSYCDDRAIESILKKARAENERLNITGILVHTHRHFMQYIEGPTQNICDLFNKIKLDYRHHDIFLCRFSDLDERLFPDWQMGYKDLTKDRLFLQGTDDKSPLEAFNKIADIANERSELLDALRIFL